MVHDMFKTVFVFIVKLSDKKNKMALAALHNFNKFSFFYDFQIFIIFP